MVCPNHWINFVWFHWMLFSRSFHSCFNASVTTIMSCLEFFVKHETFVLPVLRKGSSMFPWQIDAGWVKVSFWSAPPRSKCDWQRTEWPWNGDPIHCKQQGYLRAWSGWVQVLNRMYLNEKFEFQNYSEREHWFHVASHLLGASPAKSVGPVVSCCNHLQARKSFPICSQVLQNAYTSVPSFMIHAPNARGWHDFACFFSRMLTAKRSACCFQRLMKTRAASSLIRCLRRASDQKRWRLLNSTCHCLAAFSHGSKAFVGLGL